MNKIVLLLPALMLLLSGAKTGTDHNGHAGLRITTLKLYPGESGDGDAVIFNYNNKGNPVSITRMTAATGKVDYFFRYDAQDRLTDYAGPCQDGLFESWRQYYYDSNNRIAGDRVYYFGRVGDQGPLPDPDAPKPYDALYTGQTNSYGYDRENRIVKVSTTFNDGSIVTTRYTYNKAGNLEKKHTAYAESPALNTETVFGPYDNKVNMHRTHPIWQFIDQDYSRNNPFTADAYNAQVLPLKISSGKPEADQAFLLIPYSTLEVEYKAVD